MTADLAPSVVAALGLGGLFVGCLAAALYLLPGLVAATTRAATGERDYFVTAIAVALVVGAICLAGTSRL